MSNETGHMFTTLSEGHPRIIPISHELFLQAIIQSDPFTADYKLVTQSLKNGKEFAKALGQ